MASPAILDLDALLAPIAGDNPAGEPVSFVTKQQLEDDRKEENPNDYEPDDPARPEIFKKADWGRIERTAQELLTKSSKDLLLSARLTEALVKRHGYAGLRDGLRLMRRLVVDAWDRINPVIEDGDLDVRSGPFNWLDEADRGARFPNALRMVPVVRSDSGQYSYMDYKRLQEGKEGITKDDFDKAILATTREQIQADVEDLTESMEEVNQLARILAEKMGSVAPGLTGMRQAVGECLTFAKQVLQRKAPEIAVGAAENGQGADAGGVAVPGAGASAQSIVATRAQAYNQLAHAAAVLRQLEPHSPIPYLVQRAVELGSMPFHQLIRQLVRDANVLAELSRELGIKEETPSG